MADYRSDAKAKHLVQVEMLTEKYRRWTGGGQLQGLVCGTILQYCDTCV
jgi:hypothetical protein